MLSFDAICGEKEAGTLRLILANSFPRSALLVSKYLALLIALLLALALGALSSLLVLHIADQAGLEPTRSMLSRTGIALLASLLYVSIFALLGLFISSRTFLPATSLVLLLFFWLLLAVVIPGAGGYLASELFDLPRPTEVEAEKEALQKAVHMELRRRGDVAIQDPARPFSPESRAWAEAMNRIARGLASIDESVRLKQLRQFDLARNIASLSPTGLYLQVMERLADTGIEHYRHCLKQVDLFRSALAEWLKSEDYKDKESPHVFFFPIWLSGKPVDPSKVPVFLDSRAREPVPDAGLIKQLGRLLSYNLILFAIAYLSLARYDVR